jgi:hypothetical protein
VYFNQDPVLNASGGAALAGFGGGGRGAGSAEGQNVTPNAVPIHVSPLDPSAPGAPPAEETAGGGRGGRGGGGRGGRGGGLGGGFAAPSTERPRVVLRFGSNANELLLSGTLGGGETLVNRAAAVDVPLGKGHIVMFAVRPFWRWQSQGTFFLAFNAILNWDHLDAGKAAAGRGSAGGQ